MFSSFIMFVVCSAFGFLHFLCPSAVTPISSEEYSLKTVCLQCSVKRDMKTHIQLWWKNIPPSDKKYFMHRWQCMQHNPNSLYHVLGLISIRDGRWFIGMVIAASIKAITENRTEKRSSCHLEIVQESRPTRESKTAKLDVLSEYEGWQTLSLVNHVSQSGHLLVHSCRR